MGNIFYAIGNARSTGSVRYPLLIFWCFLIFPIFADILSIPSSFLLLFKCGRFLVLPIVGVFPSLGEQHSRAISQQAGFGRPDLPILMRSDGSDDYAEV